ncbi:16S rRNA (guanine(527)-N(7))-methyltransferase RsmG [Acetobacter sp. AN02]|uniref:16S rRNA (guanine(527)-N(7))-methyltransferase RsmG n=1 Tax=Acetobacter sp. AN02 TaxID=2894186 RepID=UPI002434511F|nr:16S rRNA (guanine(527)-N(7))-methyltransferase RsmG [Acetobacter sp. AN02]MDG6094894.1 16S rRNA (guanine(527)-N(7))-methyltransferase RsmG [Acetobacter sp. AN02]
MDVSRETQERLEVFAALLTKWNEKINLVSPKDMAHLWPRHIEDSLELVPLVPPGSVVTDLGSGGGFPGLILAIAADAHVTLVESDQRKCAFLREAARVTGCRATIVPSRIESVSLPPTPIVTARALADLPLLLEWAAPLLRPDGYALFMKGRQAEDELTRAARDWHMTLSRLPGRSPDGVILRVSNLTRV